MDATTLRWVLILIGLVIIGLIILFGNPNRKRQPRASRTSRRAKDQRRREQRAGRERREPTIGPDDVGADIEDEAGVEPGDQGELAIDAPADVSEEKKPSRPPGPQPDRIITLFLLARDNHVITGAQLLEAAVKTGMDFGEMNIFHRLSDGHSAPVFSLANGTKPGHFDRSTWHEFETTVLALFTTLPNPRPALDAWDSMLATARRMADILNAEIQDETRHKFTRQREAQIREEMRDYDRGQIHPRD